MRVPGTSALIASAVAAKCAGTAVGQVVSVDRRDDDVAQSQTRDGAGDPARLLGVDRERAAVRHGAEGTVAGTRVTEQHERGGLVPPALAEIRAARLLAHGVQSELLHHRARFQEARSRGHTDLEPGRVPRRRGGVLRAHGPHSGDATSAGDSRALTVA